MTSTILNVLEDIANLIKSRTVTLIETVINHDHNERDGVTHISINLTLKHNKKENE